MSEGRGLRYVSEAWMCVLNGTRQVMAEIVLGDITARRKDYSAIVTVYVPFCLATIQD